MQYIYIDLYKYSSFLFIYNFSFRKLTILILLFLNRFWNRCRTHPPKFVKYSLPPSSSSSAAIEEESERKNSTGGDAGNLFKIARRASFPMQVYMQTVAQLDWRTLPSSDALVWIKYYSRWRWWSFDSNPLLWLHAWHESRSLALMTKHYTISPNSLLPLRFPNIGCNEFHNSCNFKVRPRHCREGSLYWQSERISIYNKYCY